MSKFSRFGRRVKKKPPKIVKVYPNKSTSIEIHEKPKNYTTIRLYADGYLKIGHCPKCGLEVGINLKSRRTDVLCTECHGKGKIVGHTGRKPEKAYKTNPSPFNVLRNSHHPRKVVL